MKKITIAIDGYSACGKSSTAKKVAEELQYKYIDTGAMYRAVTLYFISNYINLTNPKAVNKALEQIDLDFKPNPKTSANEIYLNGLNVEGLIRDMKVSKRVSEVSTIKEVRDFLVAKQRKLGKRGGVVMDGRDIGTEVFPEAQLKIFMEADFEVRAARRQAELLERGDLINLDEVKENLMTRDQIDTSREISPLRKAEDAISLDTTQLFFEDQVEIALNWANEKLVQEIEAHVH